jgi:hypothetical protein
VYSRACLSRTVVIVAALLLTAASANAVAREFRELIERIRKVE